MGEEGTEQSGTADKAKSYGCSNRVTRKWAVNLQHKWWKREAFGLLAAKFLCKRSLEVNIRIVLLPKLMEHVLMQEDGRYSIIVVFNGVFWCWQCEFSGSSTRV